MEMFPTRVSLDDQCIRYCHPKKDSDVLMMQNVFLRLHEDPTSSPMLWRRLPVTERKSESLVVRRQCRSILFEFFRESSAYELEDGFPPNAFAARNELLLEVRSREGAGWAMSLLARRVEFPTIRRGVLVTDLRTERMILSATASSGPGALHWSS
ncbi:hypothetical protein B0T14DRAFT_566294 [Immersiella caudata]|uniref:Uncharacterized protein n=1 Tax=Immersiella caudata TaxID=314043 RepID=A0AA39WPZ2_9PEZI|nr:hypothetical protein B0T14DRAFT_566294 [Immersiella caudata]